MRGNTLRTSRFRASRDPREQIGPGADDLYAPSSPCQWLAANHSPVNLRGGRNLRRLWGWLRGGNGYEMCRVAIACLLLIGALLKAWQVLFAPASLVLAGGVFSSKWAVIAIVEAEMFLAACLLMNLWRRTIWIATLVLFCGFAAYSTIQIMRGADSCGCFGSVALHPAWSVAINVLAVAMLWRWRPVAQRAFSSVDAQSAIGAAVVPVGRDFGLVRGAAVFFSVGLVGGVLVLRTPAVVGIADTAGGTSDEIVMLDPYEWIGRTFPVAEYTGIGSRLTKGNWIVILYHGQCPKCQEILAELGRLTPRIARAGSRIAAIEVPVEGTAKADGGRLDYDWEWGCLDVTRRWIARTPLLVVVENGVVRFGRSNVANLEDVLRQAAYLAESRLKDAELSSVEGVAIPIHSCGDQSGWSLDGNRRGETR